MIYTLEPDQEPEVLAVLGAERRLPAVEELSRRLTYLDTFDWKLHWNDSTLAAIPEARGVLLEWRSFGGALRHRARLEEAPAFARELPPGPLADALAACTDVRRLLPVVEVETHGKRLRVLDEREKTVVRLELERGTVSAAAWDGRGDAGSGSLPLRLRLLPVKGYEEELERLIGVLESGLGLVRCEVDELTTALAVLGRRPRDYTSKLDIPVQPEMPAAEAARLVHRHLLATLKANEEGTRRGLDAEFLHDFRVAVRRTRSALGQIRGVFPRQPVADFRRELGWLGELTGPARDLDVFHLELDGYLAALPRRVRDPLNPLRLFLETQQRVEQQRLARALRSKRYRQLIHRWSEFLEAATPQQEPQGDLPPSAARPIREVASERIWRAWRRVVKRGREIFPDSPPDALHRLRIECKKLRYLLEFFRRLYDEQEIARLVKALKKLQDVLGDLNDYEVQQRKLEEFADQMVMEDLALVPTLLAMGRLQERLARGQEDERGRFAARFAAFTSAKNKARFRRLFRPAQDAEP